MSVESTVVFQARVAALGLEELWNTMTTLGFTNYQRFAFATHFAPGGPDDQFVNDIVVPLTGNESSPLKSALRHLLFEAYTLVVADTRRRMEKPGLTRRHFVKRLNRLAQVQ